MGHIKSWRIALPSLRDVLPMLLEARAQLFGLCALGGIPGRHHDIHRRQAVLIQPKALTCEPLDAIACHGGAEGARCDGQSQPRATGLIGDNGQTEVGVGYPLATLPYGAKLGRLMQALARLERQPGCHLGIVSRSCAMRQGQRRLRPFARRRASNRRPLLVAIRARKPWVRARCKLLGLKVRFIAQLQETKGANQRTA